MLTNEICMHDSAEIRSDGSLSTAQLHLQHEDGSAWKNTIFKHGGPFVLSQTLAAPNPRSLVWERAVKGRRARGQVWVSWTKESSFLCTFLCMPTDKSVKYTLVIHTFLHSCPKNIPSNTHGTGQEGWCVRTGSGSGSAWRWRRPCSPRSSPLPFSTPPALHRPAGRLFSYCHADPSTALLILTASLPHALSRFLPLSGTFTPAAAPTLVATMSWPSSSSSLRRMTRPRPNSDAPALAGVVPLRKDRAFMLAAVQATVFGVPQPWHLHRHLRARSRLRRRVRHSSSGSEPPHATSAASLVT